MDIFEQTEATFTLLRSAVRRSQGEGEVVIPFPEGMKTGARRAASAFVRAVFSNDVTLDRDPDMNTLHVDGPDYCDFMDEEYVRIVLQGLKATFGRGWEKVEGSAGGEYVRKFHDPEEARLCPLLAAVVGGVYEDSEVGVFVESRFRASSQGVPYVKVGGPDGLAEKILRERLGVKFEPPEPVLGDWPTPVRGGERLASIRGLTPTPGG